MRDLRIAAGLFQTEVGPELGVNNDTINRWEKSGRQIKKIYWEAFERLARDPERVSWIRKSRLRKKREAK
jgi:hypothetical protein